MGEQSIDLAKCDFARVLAHLREAGVPVPRDFRLREAVNLLRNEFMRQCALNVAMAVCDECLGPGPAASDECPFCGVTSWMPESFGEPVADCDSADGAAGNGPKARVDRRGSEDRTAAVNRRFDEEPLDADEEEIDDLPSPPKNAIGREVHPAAELFPMLEGDALRELADDIAKNGLREQIVLYEGKILDGRNRRRACELAGMPELAICIEYDGNDPVAFVLSANLHRRQLDDDGRAFVAARLATLRHGQRQSGQLAGVPTQAEAARALNVPERRVRRAKQVLEYGSPELVAAVVAGDVPVSAAAKATKESPAKQRELLEAARAPKPKNPQHSSESDEHWSPLEIVDAARHVLGTIDLDPASCAKANQVVRASRIITRKDNGLAKRWRGHIFVNPPGGRLGHDSAQAVWWSKLVEEHDAGRVTEAIFVAFSIELLQTSQGSKGKTPHDFAICFPKKRLDYRTPEGTARSHAPHASAIVYIGKNVGRFVAAFKSFGCFMGPLARAAVDRRKKEPTKKEPTRVTPTKKAPKRRARGALRSTAA